MLKCAILQGIVSKFYQVIDVIEFEAMVYGVVGGGVQVKEKEFINDPGERFSDQVSQGGHDPMGMGEVCSRGK
jgi:hypothetical protein